MAKSGRVAIAELVSRGKEQLVLIRTYRKGLVLHTMYQANEARDFDRVPKGEKTKIPENELVPCPLNSLHISPVIPGKPALAGATRNLRNRKQSWIP